MTKLLLSLYSFCSFITMGILKVPGTAWDWCEW